MQHSNHTRAPLPGSHRLCAIPGDGIGREVVPAALQVVRALLPDVTVVEAEAGFDCFTRHGKAVPAQTLAAIASCEATLFGATASPSYPYLDTGAPS